MHRHSACGTFPQAQFNHNVKVANNVFRHLLNINVPCSISEVFMYNRVNSFPVLLLNSAFIVSDIDCVIARIVL